MTCLLSFGWTLGQLFDWWKEELQEHINKRRRMYHAYQRLIIEKLRTLCDSLDFTMCQGKVPSRGLNVCTQIVSVSSIPNLLCWGSHCKQIHSTLFQWSHKNWTKKAEAPTTFPEEWFILITFICFLILPFVSSFLFSIDSITGFLKTTT